MLNASVRYTTQSHPEEWTVKDSEKIFSPELRRHFESCEGCYRTVFSDELLDDGAAIMGHDAIILAVTAIRADQGPGIDRVDLVSQQFKRMHGKEVVGGASGWISLKDGNVVNKSVAILGVISDGTVRFLDLSSVGGSPCVPPETGSTDKEKSDEKTSC
jgi:hypothetical protein